MYPDNPEGTQVIVGSMNMGYISDTARNQTHNLFHPKRELIPLGHCERTIYFTVHHAIVSSYHRNELFPLRVISSQCPFSTWVMSWTIAPQFNSIQYRHLHVPTYKLSRWHARLTKQKLNDKCMPSWGQEKVNFQFSFEALQRAFRVTQMHWECVPGSKVESSRTYRLGFRLRDWQRPFQVSQMISDERGLGQACRDQTGSEERVTCRHLYTRVHDLASWASATVNA